MGITDYIPGLETAKMLAMKPINLLKKKTGEVFQSALNKVIGGVQSTTRMALSGVLKGIMSIPILTIAQGKNNDRTL